MVLQYGVEKLDENAEIPENAEIFSKFVRFKKEYYKRVHRNT
jgi:hypothetical protein